MRRGPDGATALVSSAVGPRRSRATSGGAITTGVLAVDANCIETERDDVERSKPARRAPTTMSWLCSRVDTAFSTSPGLPHQPPLRGVAQAVNGAGKKTPRSRDLWTVRLARAERSKRRRHWRVRFARAS